MKKNCLFPFLVFCLVVFVTLEVSCGGNATMIPGSQLTSSTSSSSYSGPTYDITTLAGKVASLNGTAGLQIRFSAFIEEEADTSVHELAAPGPFSLATPTFLLSSPLDGSSVGAPNV